jgi:hypothetical protein
MHRRLLLTGLCAVMAAGCTSTISGSGSYTAGNSPGPTASATSEPSPTETRSESPSASPGPPTTAQPPSPGRTTLKCSGKVIHPTGSPYCYTKPSGFIDVSSTVTVTAGVGTAKYRTAVAVANRDLIIVSVYQLTTDSDELSSDLLESELKTVIGRLAQQGFTFDSTTARRGVVDGARLFGYHARESAHALESDLYFIFRAKNEVEVNCQWQQRRSEVKRACQQVLASLQIKSVK